MIYAREEAGITGGFPTLPTTAPALWPFLLLDDVPTGILWASLKIALAWWMLATCCRMAADHGQSFPPWALSALLLLCGRVLLSDIAHGNVNMLVAALVVAAGRAWQLKRAWRWSATALACSAVLHGLSGSAILGERGSDYAEAWGVWFLGGLALFVACGLVVRRSQLRST